jgi:hypothetical protein
MSQGGRSAACDEGKASETIRLPAISERDAGSLKPDWTMGLELVGQVGQVVTGSRS